MSRATKIERLRKYQRTLYLRVKRALPNLVNNPNQATIDEIFSYNDFIAVAAKRDKNPNAFIKNFSFEL